MDGSLAGFRRRAQAIVGQIDDRQPEAARLRGHTGHLLHCGSIWRAGPSLKLPLTEENGPPPLGEYGIAKDAIARLLKAEIRSGGLVTTSVHPGHIVGPGWHPIGPLGNLDPTVWRTLSAGEPLTTRRPRSMMCTWSARRSASSR